MHDTTGGWPAAVRLTAEALARVAPDERRSALERLSRPGGVVHDYLADEVVASEPELTRRLLVRLSVLDRFTPDLAEALGPTPGTLTGLVRRGLVVDAPGRGRSWLRVNALLRGVAAAGAAPEARAETLAVAAEWLAAHDQPAAAVRCALAAGDGQAAVRLVEGRGRELLRAGERRRPAVGDRRGAARRALHRAVAPRRRRPPARRRLGRRGAQLRAGGRPRPSRCRRAWRGDGA